MNSFQRSSRQCLGLGRPEHPVTPQISAEARELARNTKRYLEKKYGDMHKRIHQKQQRSYKLESTMDILELDATAKSKLREELNKLEDFEIRQKRLQMKTNDFIPLRIVGKGSFGQVRLVKERRTGRILAMKTMSKSIMIQKKQVGHLRAEKEFLAQWAELLASKRDNAPQWIVELYYSFHDAYNLYLVMEFLPGGDFMCLLVKENILTENASRFYAVEMILAIDAVHKLGYIHRDVKPDNLLLDWNGHLKLSDLGLCKKVSQSDDNLFSWGNFGILHSQSDSISTTTSSEVFEQKTHRSRKVAYSIVGTPDYLAPEVLAKNGYGKECDWWSLGGIIFECLCGHPPFYANNPQTICQKVMAWRKTLQFPSGVETRVDRSFFNFINRLLCDPCVRMTYEGLRSHRWLSGINFDTIHLQRAPFVPNFGVGKDLILQEMKHLDHNSARFEQLIDQLTSNFEPHPDEPLPIPANYSVKAIRRRHKIGDTKFLGYTFRRDENPSEKLIDFLKKTAPPPEQNPSTRPRSLSLS